MQFASGIILDITIPFPVIPSHAQSLFSLAAPKVAFSASVLQGFHSSKTSPISKRVHEPVRESEVPDARPPPADRLFNSTAVEEKIVDVGSRIRDDTIRQIFSNCLPSTLGNIRTEFCGHDCLLLTSSFLLL